MIMIIIMIIIIHMVQSRRCRYRSQSGHVSIDSLQIPLFKNFLFLRHTHLRCKPVFYTPTHRGFPRDGHIPQQLNIWEMNSMTSWPIGSERQSFVEDISKKKSPKRLPRTTLLIGKCWSIVNRCKCGASSFMWTDVDPKWHKKLVLKVWALRTFDEVLRLRIWRRKIHRCVLVYNQKIPGHRKGEVQK